MQAAHPVSISPARLPAQAARARQRYELLDGLRGLAALTIVVHHFTATSGHRELFASSSIAVEFFFCVAGFVAAASHQEKLAAGMPFGSYARRRLLRIYPMYGLGLLLGVAALSLMKEYDLTSLTWNGMASALAFNSLLLPYLNDANLQVLAMRIHGAIFPFNGPAWSLFFLLVANALYAGTVRRWRSSPLLWLAASAVALFYAGLVWPEAPGWATENWIGGFARVSFSFFAGTVLFQVRGSLRLRIPAALLVALVVALYAVPQFPAHRYYWLAASLVLVPLLVGAAANVAVDRRSAIRRTCLYSGRVSYPVYCLHYPLLMLVSIATPRGTPYPVVFAGFVVFTLAVSHLAMKLVEERVRARLAAEVARE